MTWEALPERTRADRTRWGVSVSSVGVSVWIPDGHALAASKFVLTQIGRKEHAGWIRLVPSTAGRKVNFSRKDGRGAYVRYSTLTGAPRKLDSIDVEVREERDAVVIRLPWADGARLAVDDGTRGGPGAAAPGDRSAVPDRHAGASAGPRPAPAPLTPGSTDKGGRNTEPSRITTRPPPPAPLRAAANFDGKKMRPAVDPSADADAVARFIAERGVRKVMSPEQVAQFLRDSGHDVTIVVSSNGKTYDAYSTPKLDGTECSMIEMYEVANALRNKSGLALIAMPEEPAEAAT